LQRIDTFLLGFLILAMCSQIDPLTVGRDTLAEGLGYATKTLKVALSDIALLLCFLWFLFRTASLRAGRKLWWPPLPCWALIMAMVVSLVHSPHVVDAVADTFAKAGGPKGMVKAVATKESKEAIAEVLQFGAYFILAPLLFVNLLQDRRNGVLIERRRFALHVFSFAVLLNVLVATYQLLAFARVAPRGLFGSPNIYAVFLAMSLPLLVAMVMREWTKVLPPLIVTGISLLLGLLTVASVWAMLAILVGIIVAGVLQRVPMRTVVVGAASLIIFFTAWNTQVKLKSHRLETSSVSSATQAVKKQYVEWYAALGWAVPKGQELPLGVAQLHQYETGVGPGNYQQNIGPYYSSLPNEEKMPPDSNNLYLVQAVSIGVLGLGALLWVIGHFMGTTRSAMRVISTDWLPFGVFAALCAWMVVNVFHAGIVRGNGVVLEFIMSLAVVAASRSGELLSGETVEDEVNDNEVEPKI
jgi:MFS family permease